MKKYLIIGGAGYTGSVLVRDLLFKKKKITVVDNFIHKNYNLYNFKNDKNLKIINNSIFDLKNNKINFKEFDYIFPLSGIVGDPACKKNKKRTIRENTDSLKFLLDQNFKKNYKLIYPSSCSVYGLLDRPANERNHLNPQSLYAETKIYCENLLKEIPIKNCIILRLPTIYGLSPRMRFDLVVNKMTLDLIKKKKITVYNPFSYRPLLSTNDLSKIFIKASSINNNFYTYNIGSVFNNYSLEQIARNILHALHDKIKSAKSIEYHDEISDKRSYAIILDRFNKEFKSINFNSIDYEVQKIFKYINKYKNLNFNNKNFLNHKI